MKTLKHYWPYLFLFIAWCIFASPYFLKGLVPFPSKFLVSFFPPWSAAFGMAVKNNAMPDVITQIYPWKLLTINAWKMGQIPLWNPYSFSGTPHAGNYQSAIFTPFNLLFFILPQIDAWSLLVLLQPLLAGLFAYLFLRSVERSKLASLVGSLAFMFCGFITVWMAYATLGYAALWLPLILFGIHGYMKKPTWAKALLVSMGLGLSFLSGHFQISLYVLFFTTTFLVFEMIQTKKVKRGFLLGGYIIAGLLIAAPQFAASFHSYSLSPRSSSFVKGEIIPWQYIVTVLAPDFFGQPVTRNDWFGHYAEWSSYIGVIPFLLAIYAILHKKRLIEWVFLLLGIVSLFFAYPTFLSDLLFASKIPVLSTSAASRVIILFSFSGASLSAFGFDQMRIDWEKKKYGYAIVLGILVLLVFSSVWASVTVFKSLPIDKLIIAKRNLSLPTALALITIPLLFLGFLKQKKLRQIILIAFVCIVALDMLRFSVKWMPFDPKEFVYPNMDVLTFLQKNVGANRIFGNFGNEMATSYSLQSLEGYDAVYVGRYGEFISAAGNGKIQQAERSVVVIGKQGEYTERILELLGVRYVLHRLSDGRNVWAYPYWKYPFYNQVYRDNYYSVWENANALPRAYLTSSYTLVHGDQQIIDTVLDSKFDDKENVVLEHKPNIDPQVGDGKVSIAQYSPEKITLRTQSSVAKMLVLSDAYDEGWKATIDGKETQIYRANYDFRSVGVPAGRHTIIFYYDPFDVKVGIYIAIAVLVFLLGAGAVSYYEYRHL